MGFDIVILLLLLAVAVAVLFFVLTVYRLEKRVRTLEKALSGVKPVLEEHARLANEVRDIRAVVDELPVEEIVQQAAYEKMYAESLEAINNYSVEVAMGGGERN